MQYGSVVLFIAAAIPAVAGAQVDMYGRDISKDRVLPPALTARAEAFADTAFSPTAADGFTLLPYVATKTGSWPDAVAIGDVTGDKRADVVLATAFYFDPANDYNVFVFPQYPFGTLGAPSQTPYGQTPSRAGLALGDFDGRNGLDVAVGGNRGVSILSSTAVAPWLALDSLVLTQEASAIGALDLQGDGKPDIASVSWSNGGNTYLNNGYGQFTPAAWSNTAAGFNSMAVGDLDGDGVDDTAIASGQGQQNIALSRNNGDGTLTQFGALLAQCNGWSPGAWGIGIGDVDGDGDGNNDIIASSGGNKPLSCMLVFRGDGHGQFAAPVELPSYDCPEALVVADMNRDGRKDVVVAHGGWSKLGVYLQKDDGTLAPEVLFPIPYASHYDAHDLAVGDFTGDGCPDVAIADYNNGLVTLKNGMRCMRRL